MTAGARGGNLQKKNRIQKNISAWAIMLPTLVLFAFFIWEPILESIRLSTYRGIGVDFSRLRFVGLDNYRLMFIDPNFKAALSNTFIYILWSLIIGFFVPLIMAALISETAHLKSAIRVAIYFPNIMPGLATAIIWTFLFRPGPTGVLNIILGWLGLAPFNWLSARGWTIPLIITTMTWKSAGSTALIYMAGIAGINPELYEAATIDGAKPMRRFWHITLPGLLSLGKTMLILQIISVFQVLYEPMMMTNGGPNNKSISMMMLVYQYAFRDFNYAMGTTISVFICLILAVLTIIYFALTRKVSNE
ncbi:MAG: sugar ABC transporter permease [Oscillospiraceae bacterium]|jgi:multiple sugar transport system permease protein|nr:sugar ABC transporter permease [Oscillospiraceae bacterium]